jgi:hypothetical protein
MRKEFTVEELAEETIELLPSRETLWVNITFVNTAVAVNYQSAFSSATAVAIQQVG